MEFIRQSRPDKLAVFNIGINNKNKIVDMLLTKVNIVYFRHVLHTHLFKILLF